MNSVQANVPRTSQNATETLAPAAGQPQVDMNKPLVWQVFNGGMRKQAYLDWVHQPHHPKRHEPKTPRLFHTGALEACTRTAWQVVPSLWLPVAAGLWVPYMRSDRATLAEGCLLGASGACVWTALEYGLHRFVFHGEAWLPDHPAALTAHFFLHGIHHKIPADPQRLVMPPALTTGLALGLWGGLRALLAWVPNAQFAALFGTGLAGYVAYDLTHYALHHAGAASGSWLNRRKTAHMIHHGSQHQRGFGVTSGLWDWLLGTELRKPAAS